MWKHAFCVPSGANGKVNLGALSISRVHPRTLLAVGFGQQKSSSRVSVRERWAGRNRDPCAWLAHSRGCLETATLGS